MAGIKKKSGEKIFEALNYILMGIFGLIMLGPLVYVDLG